MTRFRFQLAFETNKATPTNKQITPQLDSIVKDKSKYPSLQTIALFDGATDVEKEKGKGAGLEIVSFVELEEEGKAHPSEPIETTGDDISTIMYTSGTTGLPKGVILLQKNMLAEVAGIEAMGKAGTSFLVNKSDIHLSYLPLAHVFERMIVTYCLITGARVGFYQGSAMKLLDDLAELRPTVFPSVPRLLNRIYDKIVAAVDMKGGMSASVCLCYFTIFLSPYKSNSTPTVLRLSAFSHGGSVKEDGAPPGEARSLALG